MRFFYHTRATFAKILNDFRKIRNSITISVHVMSIAYLIYALAIHTGFLAVNISLLALTSAYFVFFIIMELTEKTHTLRRAIKEFYCWSKRLIRLPVLGIAVYGLAVSKTEFDPLSFLITLLMIIGWLLDLLFYFIIRLVEVEKEYFTDSIHADVQSVPWIGDWLSSALPESDNAEEHLRKLEPFIEQVAEQDARRKRMKKNAKAQKKAEKRAKKLAKLFAVQDQDEVAAGNSNDEV